MICRKNNKPKVNAWHTVCDLLKSLGDVFDLAVQEHRLLYTLPFISREPKAGLQKAADLIDGPFSYLIHQLIPNFGLLTMAYKNICLPF